MKYKVCSTRGLRRMKGSDGDSNRVNLVELQKKVTTLSLHYVAYWD